VSSGNVFADSGGSPAAELVAVDMIWDEAPHNAFTDLVRWNGRFYCAFREGDQHVSDAGKIRILVSPNADRWSSTALLELDGWDLRDPHLSVTPADRLMLVGGACDRPASPNTGTVVSLSDDGYHWTAPRVVVDPGWWLWQVQWRENACWGFAYLAFGYPRERGYGEKLLKSTDGINWTVHVENAIDRGGSPTEAAIRFNVGGSAYALVRRNGESALLGKSSGDLTSWKWYDLGDDSVGFGGPNLVHTPHGWIGGGRMHDEGANMSLTYIDVENSRMERILKLPSGGDCSYPGLVWYDDMLYVSYYSTHEGKTSVYLAKVKIKS